MGIRIAGVVIGLLYAALLLRLVRGRTVVPEPDKIQADQMDTVVAAFQDGLTAEEIAEQYPARSNRRHEADPC